MVAALVAAGSIFLGGCSAAPGPAPVVEPTPSAEESEISETTSTSETTPTTTTEAEPARAEISVGVQPLRNGLNPHLLADNTSTVQSLASLVLPSVFRHGELDTDVMVSAEEIAPAPSAPGAPEPVVQTVRYVISPEAQWSDGTPITGADFRYLWEAMNTTPAVVDPAGYQAISEVRSLDGGKTVEVDFTKYVADWQDLFTHLLPSHLAEPGGADFETAFFDDLPASAGRFQVESVDRSRAVLTLHRNDRFWGEDPASIDVLHFRGIRSVSHGVELMRSGQIGFLDLVPSETSTQAYNLIPGTQLRSIAGPRQLQLVQSTSSPLLGDVNARAELASLIDVPLVARLAAGRTADLSVPEHTSRPDNAAPPALLQQITAERPLRLAADPADEPATAAARTIVDLLARHGVNASVVATDLPNIAQEGLPAGDIDAVVMWEHTDGSPADLVSKYQCPPAPEAPRVGNLSGFCTPESQHFIDEILAGNVDEQTAREGIAQINEIEHLYLPLLNETRVEVLGEGIVGPDPNLSNWPTGLESAPMWRREQ